MTTITVSLTRAHKVAERLKTHATALLQESMTAAAPQTLQGRAPAMLSRLKDQGYSAMPLSEAAERTLRAAALVRDIIARENVTRGISAKLAQLDAVNKLVGHTKGLLAIAQTGTLELGEVESYEPLQANVSFGSSMSVNVVPVSARERFMAALTRLQREAMLLSDEIAEANAAQVSFELEADLAELAVGKA